MNGKKVLSLALAATMSLGLLSACGGGNDTPAGGNTSTPAGNTSSGGSDTSGTTIKVAAIETSYGTEVWQQVADAFTEQTGINVELVTDKKLEDVIGPAMQGGEYPDVIHLAVGREAGLTEQFIKDKNIAEITDVLSMNVPGEDVTVGEKIIPGFVNDNSTTNPYADGKTYLAPMFYSPCGLFYNKGLFEEKGWEVPTTWDETVFLDGYPGKYVVLARRHGDRWYIAGINAGKEPLKLTLNLPMCQKGDKVSFYSDAKDRTPQLEQQEIKKPAEVKVTIQPEGGVIWVK